MDKSITLSWLAPTTNVSIYISHLTAYETLAHLILTPPYWGWGHSSVIQHVLSMHQPLGSISSIPTLQTNNTNKTSIGRNYCSYIYRWDMEVSKWNNRKQAYRPRCCPITVMILAQGTAGERSTPCMWCCVVHWRLHYCKGYALASPKPILLAEHTIPSINFCYIYFSAYFVSNPPDTKINTTPH